MASRSLHTARSPDARVADSILNETLETPSLLDSFRRLKYDRPLAILDLATTGPDPKADRIIEVALLKYDPAKWPVEYRRRVNPGVPIPVFAKEAHGISTGEVKGKHGFKKIAARLAHLLAGADLVGYGLKTVGLPILVAEFRRHDVAFEVKGRSVIDIKDIFEARELRHLTAAASFYCGIELTDDSEAEERLKAIEGILDAQMIRYADYPAAVKDLHRHLAATARLE
jgi:DNA polymerase-3 subunit epsilon